jgi:hypothetical protein
VVWSPVWPRADDQVTVLYDTRGALARFKDAGELTWFLTSEGGHTEARRTAVGPGGVAVFEIKARALTPGWFAFGRGEARDNDCGNPWTLPIVPEAPRWQKSRSAHFEYRWLPGDPVEERVTEVLAALEAHLALVVERLGLELPAEPIVFLHYADREIGFTYQAHHGNNADEFRHLVFSEEAADDAHELTHLLIAEQLGRHHAGLFDEGVATHLGQELAQGVGWQGRSSTRRRGLGPAGSCSTARRAPSRRICSSATVPRAFERFFGRSTARPKTTAQR